MAATTKEASSTKRTTTKTTAKKAATTTKNMKGSEPEKEEPPTVNNVKSTAVRVKIGLVTQNEQLDFTQMREKLDTGKVKEYADKIKEDANALPPVKLWKDQKGTYWIGDGFHRLHAHIRNGEPEIMAFVQSGDKWDALEQAVKSNHDHGLPRSRGDLYKIIKTVLTTQRLRKKANSDHAIAEMIGSTQPTVSAYRKKLEEAGDIEPRTKVVGKDGVERDVSKNKVEGGKNKKAKPEEEGTTPTTTEPAALPTGEKTETKQGEVPETTPADNAPEVKQTPYIPTVDGRGEAVPEELEGVFVAGEKMRVLFEKIGTCFAELDEFTGQLLKKTSSEYETWQETVKDTLQLIEQLQANYQPFAVIHEDGKADWASRTAFELDYAEESE